MSGCSMALRHDDRGSSLSKPYYNGKSSGRNAVGGKDRSWNNTADGAGRFGNDFRESTTASADHHSRKHDRKKDVAAAASNRHQEHSDDRSNAGDSDKAALKQFGDWTEQLSSGGKKYYYNCRTEVSQWEKPSEWIAWEKRSGTEQINKRRAERSGADEQISPSHSSTGRLSGSRDHCQNTQHRKSGGPADGGAAYDNAYGRSFSNQSRRSYANNVAGPSRSNDNVRGSRSKYDHKGGHVSTNLHPFDGQPRFDQHDFPNNAGVERERGLVEHRERSKRPSMPVPSTSREFDNEDNSLRERSPKRSKFTPMEHGNMEIDGPDKRNCEQRPLSTAAMDVDDDDLAADVQIDMERLPHLLVEIAEKNNIDLSDPDALEKIKRHLKTALCHELNSGTAGPSKNGGPNCHFSAVSDDEDETPKPEEQLPASRTGDRDGFIDEKEQAQVSDSAGPVTKSSLAELFNKELIAHISGWSAEHFEVQANQLSSTAFRISLDASHISADLKCARSLVRTVEIRSTLLEQRISYLRQQYHELETMSKPSSAAIVSGSLISS